MTNLVDLYTTEGCGLCDEAKIILLRLQDEYSFRLAAHVLTEEHPKFKEYFLAVPVVVINQKHSLSGRIAEIDLRKRMNDEFRPSRRILAFKFLEALGFVTVGAGLFYGVARNDEWQELYFMIAGITLFAIGRILEKRELKKSRQ